MSSNNRVFGQAMKKKKPYGGGGGGSKYQRQFGGMGSSHSKRDTAPKQLTEEQIIAQRKAQYKAQRKADGIVIDKKFGYEQYSYKSILAKQQQTKSKSKMKSSDSNNSSNDGRDGESKRGWLFNMLPTTVNMIGGSSEVGGGSAVVLNDDDIADGPTPDNNDGGAGVERSGIDLYFLEESGSTFKSTVLYEPYFYVVPTLLQKDVTNEVIFDSIISMLLNKYENSGLSRIEVITKIDLDQANHLSPKYKNGRPMLKMIFDNVQQLIDVRTSIKDIIARNIKKQKESEESSEQFLKLTSSNSTNMDIIADDPLSLLVDIREYDVPYLVRVCIDMNIRVGAWYTVTPNAEDYISVTLSEQDVETKGNPKFLAFDIECTKAPLKFPDATVDSIFMISYMIDGQGYLIISRDIVGSDIANFEYTPKPNYPGPFHIFNEKNEEDLIRRFISEYQQLKPQIVVTYNGDNFDWPFLQYRAEKVYGLSLYKELGIERIGSSNDKNNDKGSSFVMSGGEYRGRCCVHLDAFHWVQRDSYLPQGSQGLKAVTKYKLGYDPVEVDPEDMVLFAKERPVHMASYSVSDAVATYYLYEKYVHLFIFSLCTIIPMNPEDVLRKGSGTLCETLLMVQACTKQIICPNKQIESHTKFTNKGHLLESETYIGGKVECLETGVYRSDIEYTFKLVPSAFQQLIDNVDRDLTFAIEVEYGLDKTNITNYDEIRCQIIEQLEMLRDRPNRVEKPYIYHLDVGAMYPNIILTNRLQPSAIVDDATCAACDYNQSKNGCKRRMEWVWRGDYNPATKQEYDRTKDQLSREIIRDGLPFHSLDEREQAGLISSRLKTYAKNAYKKTKVTEEESRYDTVCMRENDFYVETVRRFRDRRYELKKLTKTWKKKIGSSDDVSSKKEAEDKALVYDSLQVAHKCILNSFYGYVMRKGARWRSMEMAGIVTKNGADLITQARILVEQIGRPLELDTDGIWCILPKSFPDVYNFKCKDGSKVKLEYPCVMLNADVHDKFTNHQYQTMKDPDRGIYESRSDNSIFFEVDGPYRCMVLPASTEEGRLLKKRYAVFNFDGSLAELKGFELKRRGELDLIKTFQSQVFERFLDGKTLEECYDSVAEVANHWIDVLDTHGESMEIDELVDLITENRSMSKQLDEYGDQKGTSQTTARRLGEFLGSEIIKDKGLNCKFIIAAMPYGAPVTERAIPTAIWKAEPAVMKHHLRKWLKSPGLDGDELDIRNILDWDYYSDRLGKTIQKIITIPAALQKVSNPVPRVSHPDWLATKVRQLNDRFQQRSIKSMFSVKKQSDKTNKSRNVPAITMGDIEDFGGNKNKNSSGRPIVHTMKRKDRNAKKAAQEETDTPQAKDDSNGREEGNMRVVLSKDNYPTWLKQKKSLWRSKRRERKRRHKEETGNRAGGSTTGQQAKKLRGPASSMAGYIRDASLALMQNELHVVEIREISSHESSSRSVTGGEFILWVMVGQDSLQKIQVTVPRTVYVATRKPLAMDTSKFQYILDIKKVEKHLPHGKTAEFLYEVKLSEYAYKTKNWASELQPLDVSSGSTAIQNREDILESLYETRTPMMLRALIESGCVVKMRPSASSTNAGKSFTMSDLQTVNRPLEGEYLHSSLQYKKIFLYISVNSRSKTGIVTLFMMNDFDDKNKKTTIDEPNGEAEDSTKMNASCHVWVVKPGSKKKSQRNLSSNYFEATFSQLLETIQGGVAEAEAAGEKSPFSSLSTDSRCHISSLNFVDGESLAFSGVNEVLNSYAQANKGPTFLLLNTSKPLQQLRRSIPSSNSFPVINLPFPPGPAHNPSMNTLPALNWESPAVQLCIEAYFYMGAVSFEKRVSYARYGHVPVGNLGHDEIVTMYDVGFSRQLQKSRTISWASDIRSSPDLGVSFLPGSNGTIIDVDGNQSNQNEIWDDDEDLISPVVRRPGAYRCVCAEIDVRDLAIAALTEATSAIPHNATQGAAGNPESPTSVANLNGSNSFIKSSEAPLGDEMSTAISLPMLRALVSVWLRDASETNSVVADEILHHVYRLISSPEPLLHDPAVHRVFHSLMKSTFMRLLSELQRLGCSIICASFQKVIVATNKMALADAQEYVEFVLSTIRNRAANGNSLVAGLERIDLQPSTYFTQYLFLDEYNFGGIQLERGEIDEQNDGSEWIIPREDGDEDERPIIPTVISGWNMMHYLGSEISQEYFRLIVGRFSKDVLRKEIQIEERKREKQLSPGAVTTAEDSEQILSYKKKLISKHFASYLTRAVGEIEKDGGGPESFKKLPGSHLNLTDPPLEFIKSVVKVLELDTDVDKEVHILKKSLLSQIGVQEYSSVTKWENPCASFILPDVFCAECQDCRDINLCDLPPPDDEDGPLKSRWECEDCNQPYDIEDIERRLVDIVNRKATRYQLQDTRCIKTGAVAVRAMSKQSECSAELKLDVPKQEALSQLRILNNLAEFHNLEYLKETLNSFVQK